jgi:hypothetical protein
MWPFYSNKIKGECSGRHFEEVGEISGERKIPQSFGSGIEGSDRKEKICSFCLP